jgi:hypothetical protein
LTAQKEDDATQHAKRSRYLSSSFPARESLGVGTRMTEGVCADATH